MSSNYPSGDASGGQAPPPGWQPAPDYLDSGNNTGGPGEPPTRGRGRRIAAIGGGIGLVALVGGGVWAWNFWFGQGPQPSEALPASTLAYVSLDLDPSGEQTVEAVQTLEEFPFFEEEFGLDLDTKDEVKKWIFEEIQDEEGICDDVDYDDDIKPWLGDRFAVAVVDREDDEPAPVLVVQVTDEDKAVDGLETLLECAQGGDDIDEGELSGYAFNGDWVVLAETEEIAKEVVDAAEDETLADDEEFKEWTESAGDPGVLTVYAAPEAGQALVDEFGDDIRDEIALEFGTGASAEDLADGVTEALEQFQGAAGTVRFEDGDLEFEVAMGKLEGELADMTGFYSTGAGDAAVGLPDTTAAVMAFGIPEDFGDLLLETFGPIIEQEMGMPIDDAIAEFEAQSGLALPEDLETLLGDSVAIALDSSIDADEVVDDGPPAVPAGIRIKGDPEEIEAVLDKLRARLRPDIAEYLMSETDGDHVVVSMNEDYLETLAEGGDLGSDDVFRDVVPHPDDASVVYFVNFDANNWLFELVEEIDGEDAAANVEPLQALGMSAWVEDDEGHLLLKLTTE